jgi:dihydroorotate dehydrogenase
MFWKLIRPLLFTLDPEEAHHLAFRTMEMVQASRFARSLLESSLRVTDDCLKSRVFGIEFSNPVGLAAGFDKDARLLPIWKALGFGFAEIGTVTPVAQSGNQKPRLFRLPADEAVINRMGFNNDGAEAVRQRLVELLREGKWPRFAVGINFGKNKITPNEKAVEDYAKLIDSFLDLGDYFVINVSSPNTPGLRELQEKSKLDEIFGALQKRIWARLKLDARPLLVKVAPDLELPQLDDVLELCMKHRLAGIIATNTTLSRQGLKTKMEETGGLSGRPLQQRSTDFIRHIYKQTKGKLPIVGVGGVFDAKGAYEKIKAGASLIQVYTGFIYEGPSLARRINEGLIELLDRDGFKSIGDAVGKSV